MINILVNTSVIKTSDTFSYADLRYGIPAAMSAIECALLSGYFWYAYGIAEYGESRAPKRDRLNIFVAAFHALNPMDVIMGIYHSILLLTNKGEMRSYASVDGFEYGSGASSLDNMGPRSPRKPENYASMNPQRSPSPAPYVHVHGSVEQLYQPPPYHDALHMHPGSDYLRASSPVRYAGSRARAGSGSYYDEMRQDRSRSPSGVRREPAVPAPFV